MHRRDVEPKKYTVKTLRLFGAFAVFWSLLITPASSADVSELPAQLQEKVEAARQACTKFDNGTLHIEWGGVDRVDLDGDLYHDWVLNERSFSCSTAVSLYCGTGGCVSHFLVEGVLHSLLNQGWGLADLGPNRVLLADVHGSQCGGINPTPCVTASTWDRDAKQWRTTGAEWE